eukprot:CAMPEP_0174705278 /NCGR_PEP_ID=MMETSP1094-20130205/8564_1 /TAXON_ID=156173 /ORGANISM="Chrysochromulina brevifilum, Strain UTEX LB 985" /LENGTH=135 /DNA_ID=CAMNT_0015903425 /DNA_START=1116 /DNA_END=1520 /DNA_ORIENTATION=+
MSLAEPLSSVSSSGRLMPFEKTPGKAELSTKPRTSGSSSSSRMVTRSSSRSSEDSTLPGAEESSTEAMPSSCLSTTRCIGEGISTAASDVVKARRSPTEAFRRVISGAQWRCSSGVARPIALRKTAMSQTVPRSQ